MRLAIIGAGASGLVLASRLKGLCDITIYEKNKKIGSKLLASGNGRCNILNLSEYYNNYNNNDFISNIINKVSIADVYNYYESLGLYLYSDLEKRVYPKSESSQTVLDILLDNIDAQILLETPVLSLKKKDNKFIINDKDYYDYVVLASGSSASIVKDPNLCYDYIKKMNLKLTDLKPSLCGFKTKDNIKGLEGVRIKANVSLYKHDKLIHKEFGEVIFKSDGISGIVIMNMSSYYNRYNDKDGFYLVLDMLYDIDINNDLNLKGLLNPKMYKYVLNNNLNKFNLKEFKINILKTYDMIDAQVCHGGIDLNEVSNLELKKYPGCFVMGEVLDIDGVCGGFNLLFASLCAINVSNIIKERIK